MRRVLLPVLAAASLAALADVEPGRWELNVTTSVDGMGAMPPMTQARCLSADDARDPSRLMGSAGCEFANKRDTGSEMSFDVKCTGQVPMNGSGTVRYSASTLDGTVELAADANGQKIMTRSQISGRRLGAC